jgi:hypothetical protein
MVKFTDVAGELTAYYFRYRTRRKNVKDEVEISCVNDKLLYSVDWLSVTDVTGKPFRPICKGQANHEIANRLLVSYLAQSTIHNL